MALRKLQSTRARTFSRRSQTHLLLIGGVLVLLLLVTIWGRGSIAAAGNGNLLVLALPAFLSGLLSFLSPCTLPILPTYFAWTFGARRERVVRMTTAFFMGLATTMVVLGASASALSQLLSHYLRELTLVGGLVIIGFGMMSLLGKGFSGVRRLDRPTANVAGSYLYGATFALGWTACVGPILGALLTMLAASGGTVLEGAILAFVYALGLGTPLIVSASILARHGRESRLWRVMRGRGFTIQAGRRTLFLHSTSIASGLLLIVTGLLLATGQLAVFSQWSVQTSLAQWLLGLEESIQRLFVGP